MLRVEFFKVDVDLFDEVGVFFRLRVFLDVVIGFSTGEAEGLGLGVFHFFDLLVVLGFWKFAGFRVLGFEFVDAAEALVEYFGVTSDLLDLGFTEFVF